MCDVNFLKFVEFLLNSSQTVQETHCTIKIQKLQHDVDTYIQTIHFQGYLTTIQEHRPRQ